MTNSVESFREWVAGWWRNPSPIDPIMRANAQDAYLAGWRDGRRDARTPKREVKEAE